MVDSDTNTSTFEGTNKTYTVKEIASMLGIGKSKAYELCVSGQFKVVRIGRALRVVKKSFDEWLEEESQ